MPPPPFAGPAAAAPVPRQAWAVLLAILVLAVVLRLWAALDDFWLDEIWSYYQAMSAPHWSSVFGIRHDNNHLLNTLFLRAVGPCTDWLWYRLPALGTGILLVAVLGLDRLARAPVAALTAAALAALSFPLILTGSEARGYAPAMLCAVLAWILLRDAAPERGGWRPYAFWACVVLGFLWHLTFVYVYAALLLFSLARAAAQPAGPRRWSELVRWHAVPMLCAGALYWFFVRQMSFGGGGEAQPFLVVLQAALALATGAPDTGLGVVTGVAAFALVLCAGVFLLEREGSAEWIFFAAVLSVAPAFVLLVRPPTSFYARYLFLLLPFLYLLSGHVVAAVWRSGRLGRAVCLVPLLFAAGQAPRNASLLTTGRGRFLDTVEFLAAETRGTTITVGSDHDFRTRMVLSFYGRYLPSERTLDYVPMAELAARPPEWFLAHRQSEEEKALPPSQMHLGTTNYRLVREFPGCGYSGWTWYVFRRR